MSDATKRVQRWAAKYDTGQVKVTLDKLRDQMLDRYTTAVVALCSLEEQVRTVLNSHGVPTNLYVSYLDYARKLYRLKQKGISGTSFNEAAQVLATKWQGRSLRADVLAAILHDVFFTPPAP
jgi:hypothetical protein